MSAGYPPESPGVTAGAAGQLRMGRGRARTSRGRLPPTSRRLVIRLRWLGVSLRRRVAGSRPTSRFAGWRRRREGRFRSTIQVMQVATGTVVNGKIVVEGVSLPEGAVVAVVTRGADESFSLTEAQEHELLAAMAEIERGEYVTLEELLQSLPKHG